MKRLTALSWAKVIAGLLCILCVCDAAAAPTADIVFVGQIPNPTDFATANATFGNHLASVESVIRGGDLFIRYRNGRIKNLTRSAGYGNSGFQGAGAIAVRDPSVSWDGRRIVFSMVVGAPREQYEQSTFHWQLYEITGVTENETPMITRVPRQPENYNNINPVYGSDNSIFFTSDRPRNGDRNLYPQRDEYESQPTVSGLWNLNPATGSLRLLDHAPSGVFEPIIDSFGRVIYTRWDHLQQDQQGDATDEYGAFDFSSESSDAERRTKRREIFPEPRIRSIIEDPGTNPHDFNHFFPWQINQDGTGHETLNHVGRHELHGYFDRSRNDDDELQEHYNDGSSPIHREILNFLHIAEDPRTPGRYYGIDAPEFRTHAAGQVITIDAPPAQPGDALLVNYVTARSTSSTDEEDLHPDHSGLYRDPQPLTDGSVVVSHTSAKLVDRNVGNETAPQSRYSFRLKTLVASGDTQIAGEPITPGVMATVSYFTPDLLASYSGPLWELQPVELVARSRPAAGGAMLEDPEKQMFAEAGVDVETFKQALRERNLALIVVRDITTRDKADLQQPFNLRVFEGFAQSLEPFGRAYDVSHLQLFQGDQIRGYGGTAEPEPGRRILATLLHDGMSANPRLTTAPPSSVRIADDGSVAAIVPGRRALTWQMTDPTGTAVVRERYWLTFQPGEIRVCASCHGVNSVDQLGRPPPSNPPGALRDLLRYLRDNPLPAGEEPPSPNVPTQTPIPTVYSLHTHGPRDEKLYARRLAQISIQALGAGSAERLSLHLSVESRACPDPVKSFVTGSAGLRQLKGKAPSIRGKRRSGLEFSLRAGGSVVASTQTILFSPRSTGASSKGISRRELRHVCDLFSRFR